MGDEASCAGCIQQPAFLFASPVRWFLLSCGGTARCSFSVAAAPAPAGAWLCPTTGKQAREPLPWPALGRRSTGSSSSNSSSQRRSIGSESSRPEQWQTSKQPFTGQWRSTSRPEAATGLSRRSVCGCCLHSGWSHCARGQALRPARGRGVPAGAASKRACTAEMVPAPSVTFAGVERRAVTLSHQQQQRPCSFPHMVTAWVTPYPRSSGSLRAALEPCVAVLPDREHARV